MRVPSRGSRTAAAFNGQHGEPNAAQEHGAPQTACPSPSARSLSGPAPGVDSTDGQLTHEDPGASQLPPTSRASNPAASGERTGQPAAKDTLMAGAAARKAQAPDAAFGAEVLPQSNATTSLADDEKEKQVPGTACSIQHEPAQTVRHCMQCVAVRLCGNAVMRF